jgi:2'-5' RNA ligase
MPVERSMIRLFVALPLPPALSDHLAALAHGLPGARWVEPDRMHLTLRFIGEVDGALADDIADALDAIHMPEFDLELRGLGTFTEKRGPAVLWAGVRPNEALARLRGKVENAMVRVGLAPERRKFHPHVTLARLPAGPDEALVRFLHNRGDWLGEPFKVTEFVLFSSFLGHGSGAIYTEEAIYPLGNKARAEAARQAAAMAEEY